MNPELGSVFGRPFMTRHSLVFLVQNSTIFFIVIGYLCQNALAYWSIGIVPEKHLSESRALMTLQSNIYMVVPYAVLLIGALSFMQDHQK